MLFNEKEAQKALDNISDAYRILSSMDRARVTKEFVDVAAHLNQRLKGLQEVNEKFKGNIKSNLLECKDTIKQGNQLEAVLQTVAKSIMNTEKVKAFLGKQLSKFMTQRVEYRLVFRPKT